MGVSVTSIVVAPCFIRHLRFSNATESPTRLISGQSAASSTRYARLAGHGASQQTLPRSRKTSFTPIRKNSPANTANSSPTPSTECSQKNPKTAHQPKTSSTPSTSKISNNSYSRTWYRSTRRVNNYTWNRKGLSTIRLVGQIISRRRGMLRRPSRILVIGPKLYTNLLTRLRQVVFKSQKQVVSSMLCSAS